jgi:putative addiction module component (TIGR02574 family)
MFEEPIEDFAADKSREDAWAAEVQRRMAAYRAGNVDTIGWTELRERLHARATRVVAASAATKSVRRS